MGRKTAEKPAGSSGTAGALAGAVARLGPREKTNEETPMNAAPLALAHDPRIGFSRSEELDLLERLIANDPAAWRSFVSAYGRLVTSTVARVLSRFGCLRGS